MPDDAEAPEPSPPPAEEPPAEEPPSPPRPFADQEPAARAARAEQGQPRALDITPAVRLDFEALRPSVESQIDEFIADREAASLPLPDRQAMIDRAAHLLGNVDPTTLVGINSLGRNKRLTLHHREVAPWFAMGTEGNLE